ncbi:hypothetical protein K402DRAFT_321194 [Aulographum hederae CBS 113979]|uniref:FHA domain-containing protein n=1 Tax=Aulographum hederae CBS 113979 TaxID=1176131 RepID=A0A6G1HHI1_9PEZI|nr:hypothetical protein K402DRAFT_321194 [Aulographum hederae CBS 113979]
MDSSPTRDLTRTSFSGFSSSPPAQDEPRRAPALLPAFEPFSSSPLPRASKRKFEDSPSKLGHKFYPTPVPTSSTGVLPSSPQRRPALERTISILSERAPLGSLPTAEVPLNGEPLLLGRSSNSSHHQLSANRLISRVHVRATYEPPSPTHASGKVVIECMGWNGCKVHCRGQVHELAKGDTFESTHPAAEVMLDVQDTRVLIGWPQDAIVESETESTAWVEGASPRRVLFAEHTRIASSPPVQPRSPVSPSPANIVPSASATFIVSDISPAPNGELVHVYEDNDEEEQEQVQDQLNHSLPSEPEISKPRPSHSRSASLQGLSKLSQSSILSSTNSEDFSDHNEENDPIIHSFGPFGDNLLPRLANFHHSVSPQQQSPKRSRDALREGDGSPKRRERKESIRAIQNESPIKNHVINQLAFSRLHSIPLSTIMGNLPMELKAGMPGAGSRTASTLSNAELQHLLDNIPCVGEINREGKDAAGKPLENEFYYVPEMDSDLMRREAVVGGRGGTGLRAVRKNHKQYYWKKPRH